MADQVVALVSKGDIENKVIAQTPDGMADVKLLVMSDGARVIVRALRALVTTTSSSMGAAGIGIDGGALPHDFHSLLLTAFRLGLAAAIVSVLINSSELLMKIDQKLPQMRA